VMNVGKDWVKAPEGAAMPFGYDNHYYLDLKKSEVQSGWDDSEIYHVLKHKYI
jgi:hypothetical protein